MLIELRIRDYAVIADVAVRLGPGLTVLTGETGAGKSIIVGALSLLLGERASTDVVRAGRERAVVEGVFDLTDRPDILAILGEHGFEADDGLLILRREVATEGRNRAWVGASPATAGVVGELGRRLVDLHGQHEHQTLLRADEQRAILDAFAGSAPLADEIRAAHERLSALMDRAARLETERGEAERRAELLRFQAAEIGAANLEPGEEARLEEEAHRLTHAEELTRLAARLHHELYAAERSIAAGLGELRRVLDQLLRIDPAPAPLAEMLETAYVNAQEVGREIGEYAASIEHEPARLEKVRRRQDLLFRLKSKYGPELDDVIETGRRAREALDALEGSDAEAARLTGEVGEARDSLMALAAELTRRRAAAAGRLDSEMAALLGELGLAGGRFVTDLLPLPSPRATGAESAEFRVALNPGTEPRPLARVASGGELSRVMLALKTILARVDRVPTLVFDEIDAGIGGVVAHHVAKNLRAVAEHHQVFVITHLPQIAARAHHHMRVDKVVGDGHAVTRVDELEGAGRVGELARMMGGDPESAAALEHARELLGV